MKFIFYLTIFVFLFGWVSSLSTAMTGGDYEIYGDVFSFVDTGYSTSTDYGLYDTGGEFFATSTSGGSYELRGGFQALEKGILTLDLSNTTLNLGSLASTTVSSASLDVSISTDSETGYTVAISENGNLRSGGNDIDDVLDGTVSVGSEEYGVRTNGSDGLLGSDTAITGSVDIASADGEVVDRSTEVLFSASIDGSTVAGSYSHVVTFTATVNP